MRFFIVIAIVLIAGALAAEAQQSASFDLRESVLNSGGSPVDGTGLNLSSTSFNVTLSSLGEGLVGTELIGPSFRVDSGFTQGLLPAGELSGLIFSAQSTLEWAAHPAAGTYNVYRDLRSNLSGLGFGQCDQQQLSGNSATDTDPVPVGDAFFYLVTVVNRLGEEGGKGHQRLGVTCP